MVEGTSRSLRRHRYEFILDAGNAELFQPRHEEQLAQALAERLGRPVTVAITPGQPSAETPAQARQREMALRREEARRVLQDDPVVQALQQRFGATLDPTSVQALDQRTLH